VVGAFEKSEEKTENWDPKRTALYQKSKSKNSRNCAIYKNKRRDEQARQRERHQKKERERKKKREKAKSSFF